MGRTTAGEHGTGGRRPTVERLRLGMRAAGHDLDLLCGALADALGGTGRVVVHLWVTDGSDPSLRPIALAVAPEHAARAPMGSLDSERPDVAAALVATGSWHGALTVASATGAADAASLDALAALLTRSAPCEEAVLAPLRVAGRPSGLVAVGRVAGAPPLARPDVATVAWFADAVALRVDHTRLVTGSARYDRQQRSLLRIAEKALVVDDVEPLLQFAADELRSVLEVDTANVFSVDDDGRTATLLANSGDLPASQSTGRFPLSPRAVARARAGDTHLHIVHAESPDFTRSTAHDAGRQAAMSVLLLPMGGQPTFLGTATINRRTFTAADQRFFAAVAHLLSAGIELRVRQARLERLARTDALTNLPSRVQLTEALSAATARAADGGRLALLLADLDDFKTINDSMGHAEGDRLLRTIAVRLAAVVRPDDLVVRLGGDEFAVLCVGVDEPAAVAIAERAIAAVAAPVSLAGRQVRPRVSVGIALHGDGPGAPPGSTEGASVAERLLQQADLAMYRAKHSGGRRVAVYDGALHDQVQRRLLVEQGLQRALQRDELELAYQPLVSLSDGRAHGYEALVRWHDAELGTVRPDELIAVAEQSMLVCELDAWVLRQAARRCVAWSSRNDGWLRIGVNVSARNFDDPTFVERVRTVLAEAGCPPDGIAVEITETHAFADQSAEAIRGLRDLGVRVVIDDYGVGYSSVARLARLPVHVLKIDRTFVAGMLDDPAEMAVVRSTIGLARQLGKVVVAEGVERPEQLRELADMGVDAVQGYLLGRPSDAATVERWIAHGLDADVRALLAAVASGADRR